MAETKQISWGFKWQKLEGETPFFGARALVQTRGGHRSLIAASLGSPARTSETENLFGADGMSAIPSVRNLVSSVPQAPPRQSRK